MYIFQRVLSHLGKPVSTRSETMAGKCLSSISNEEFQAFYKSFDVVLSDCDGVLWRETEGIPGSAEAVKKLKETGNKFFYITNNNTKSRSEFIEKCKGLNYPGNVDEIICTSYLTAMYLKEKECKKKVYVIGTEGIAKELEAVGIPHFGVGPDHIEGDVLEMIENFKPESDVGAVVIGFDDYFSYPKIVKAATYLQDPSVHFIGTSIDMERPSPNSNSFPESGCFVRCIEAASNREAVMMGKPAPYLSQFIMKKYSLDPARTLMIGDNCSTDIQLGKICGFKTLLVLSGITKGSDLENMKQSSDPEVRKSVPDFYTNQLSDILGLLSKTAEKH